MGLEQSVSDSPFYFVTGLPLCKVILSSKPSLLIAAHLFLFHEYVSVPILLPLKKLLQPRLALLQIRAGQQSPIGMTSYSHLEGFFPSFAFGDLVHSMGVTQLVPFPYCQR